MVRRTLFGVLDVQTGASAHLGMLLGGGPRELKYEVRALLTVAVGMEQLNFALGVLNPSERMAFEGDGGGGGGSGGIGGGLGGGEGLGGGGL